MDDRYILDNNNYNKPLFKLSYFSDKILLTYLLIIISIYYSFNKSLKAFIYNNYLKLKPFNFQLI